MEYVGYGRDKRNAGGCPRGVFELAVTFPPFVAIWTAMLFASHHGQFWLSFARAPLAAGLLIRLFIIQHDCGYGSFFPSKLAND